MQTGDQFSVRAPNLTTRGIAAKILEWVPRKILTNYGKTGKIAGEMFDSVGMQTLVNIIEHAARTGSQEAINLMENKTTGKKVSEGFGNLIK